MGNCPPSCSALTRQRLGVSTGMEELGVGSTWRAAPRILWKVWHLAHMAVSSKEQTVTSPGAESEAPETPGDILVKAGGLLSQIEPKHQTLF